jgi:hypothetical protein
MGEKALFLDLDITGQKFQGGENAYFKSLDLYLCYSIRNNRHGMPQRRGYDLLVGNIPYRFRLYWLNTVQSSNNV